MKRGNGNTIDKGNTTVKLLKTTFPIAKQVIKQHQYLFWLLILLSAFLGAIPTIRSQIEGGVVSQITQEIRNDKGEKRGLSEIMDRHMEIVGSEDMDYLEKLTQNFLGINTLKTSLVSYLVILVLAFILLLLSTRIKTKFTFEIFTALRQQGFSAILNKEPSELPLLQNVSAQYSNSIHQGTLNIATTYGYLIDAAQYIVTISTALVLLAFTDIKFSLLFLLLIIVQVLIRFWQNWALKKQRNKLDEKRNQLTAYTDEILTRKEILLAFDQGKNYEDKLHKHSSEFGEIDRKLEIKESFFSGLSGFFSDFDKILIPLLLLIYIVYSGKSEFTDIGKVYFIIALYSRLSYPAVELLNRFTEITKSQAMSKSFLEILSAKETDGSHSARENNCSADGNMVSFKDVSFSYKQKNSTNEKNVLTGCSFKIPRNKVSLLIGPSGCGKSTIAKLILGFWKPQQGNICIDSRGIEEFKDTRELRGLISYVSQGDHIIEETIKDNLEWSFLPKKNEQERIAAADGEKAEMLEALRKVGLLDDFADTEILAVAAKNLSGGQQQRLSIARILLDKSKLLILDEPLTGVDAFTVNKLMPELLKKINGDDLTVIIISHKMLFAGCADHVVIFDEYCRNIEEGEPKILAHQDGSKIKSLVELSIQQLQF